MSWSNRMILGDSLLVMTSLLDRERLGWPGAVHLYGSPLRNQVPESISSRDMATGTSKDGMMTP